MDRTTLLWTLTLFFGASLLFALVRRATEGEGTAVVAGAQVLALAVLIAAIVVLARRRRR